jgi:hypothetical protein
MLHKYGKWYADWRDASGKRQRKAFPSKQKAVNFQRKQAATARATKKAPRPPTLEKSRSRGRARTPKTKSSPSSPRKSAKPSATFPQAD